MTASPEQQRSSGQEQRLQWEDRSQTGQLLQGWQQTIPLVALQPRYFLRQGSDLSNHPFRPIQAPMMDPLRDILQETLDVVNQVEIMSDEWAVPDASLNAPQEEDQLGEEEQNAIVDEDSSD